MPGVVRLLGRECGNGHAGLHIRVTSTARHSARDFARDARNRRATVTERNTRRTVVAMPLRRFYFGVQCHGVIGHRVRDHRR